MTPIILAFFAITCTSAAIPTGEPFPNNYVFPEDCLLRACPNVTKMIADYQKEKHPSAAEKADMAATIQWHTANCVGKG